MSKDFVWKPILAELTDSTQQEKGSRGGTAEFEIQRLFGQIPRRQIPDTREFPTRAIAHVLVHYDTGPDLKATGWFLSRDVVITAAHALFDNGRRASTVRVVPGRNGPTGTPFGVFDSNSFQASAHRTQDDPRFDYAAIKLPSPVGDTVGFFGIRTFSDQELQVSSFDVVGYPGDKPLGTMWAARGPVVPLPDSLSYVMDTEEGDSGAPVFVASGGEIFAAGIHGGGDPLANRAVRITGAVFAELLAWKNS